MVKVFTNGVFDLLHAGHIRLLKYAKSLGTYLIVGVNSDESARLLKGPGRPIISLNDRICMLSELRCVDAVIPFEELSVEPLVRKLRPDIIVKGPDYTWDTVIGAEFVQSYGGKVVVASHLVREISTSDIIKKIKTLYDSNNDGCINK